MDTPDVAHFDHVLVGTGQATGTLIGGLPSDRSVAVLEGGRVGGTCINTGCTPTKTLLAHARVAHTVREAADYGVHAAAPEVDFAAVMERVDEVRRASREGLTRFLEGRDNVTLLRDWARFEGPRTLRVGERTVRGEHVHLNVGARTMVPPIEGLETVPWFDHASLLELRERPEHLVVIGGGYVGLEFAQALVRLGSRVTIVEAGSDVMSGEDADVSAGLRAILEAEGVTFELGTRARRVEPTEEGVRVTVEGPQGERTVSGSHVMLAVGRTPNSDGLALDAAGVTVDEGGFVRVDDELRTSADGVFALGDVNGRGAFTHTAVHDAQVVLDVLRGGARRVSHRIPIYAAFVDPPLGRVGLSEAEALRAGHRVRKAVKPMSAVARAKEKGETEGFVKLLVDADDDALLGAAVLGIGGDEVVNLLAAFMQSGQPYQALQDTVFVHPTVGELMPWFLNALEPVEAQGATEASSSGG